MPGGDRADYRSLGEILREAREGQGLERDELAQRTKIHPRMIAALESDDLEQLSGPVYARSFVRTLAAALNLDEDWLLTKLENANAALTPTRLRVPTAPATAPKSGPVAAPSGEGANEQTWKIESVRVRRVGASRRRRLPLGRLAWIAGTLGLLALTVWTIAQRMRDYEEGPPPMPTLIGEVERPEAVAPIEAGERPSDPGVEMAREREESRQGEEVPPTQPATEPAQTQASPHDQAANLPVPQGREPTSTGSRTEEYVSDERHDDRGMRSVLRLELVVQAVAPVTGSVDKATGREQFVLETGEIRRFVDPDHFELRLSDPSAVRVLLNGVPQEPPSNLGDAPWFLSLQSLR
jgi:cytoskeletal protein RodZ